LDWNTKVNSYVNYLSGENNYNFDNLKQFYNNGFEDKVVALIISKNIIKKNIDENSWWSDINRALTLFDIKINDNLRKKIIAKEFPKNPFNVACQIIKEYGYLSLSLYTEKETDNIKNFIHN
jgi:hypothetical protein